MVKYVLITFRETEKEVCVSIEGNYTKQGKKLNSMLKTLLLDNISANVKRLGIAWLMRKVFSAT